MKQMYNLNIQNDEKSKQVFNFTFLWPKSYPAMCVLVHPSFPPSIHSLVLVSHSLTWSFCFGQGRVAELSGNRGGNSNWVLNTCCIGTLHCVLSKTSQQMSKIELTQVVSVFFFYTWEDRPRKASLPKAMSSLNWHYSQACALVVKTL